jgi:hypothetical protein
MTKKKKLNRERESQSVIIDLNEEKVLFEWVGPERPFQKRNKEFWITSIVILALVSVIFFLVHEFLLIMALFSALFLYYVMSTIKPGLIKNKITNRGIYFGDVKYEWYLLEKFWFTDNLSSMTLNIETKLRFPRQVSIVVDSADKEEIKKIMVKRLPLIEDSPKLTDKIGAWFNKKFPLENKEKNEKKN